MRNFFLVCIISLLFTSFEIKAQKGKLLTTISTELPISCIKLSPNKNFIAVSDDTEDPLGFQELKEIYKINILNSENYSK
ncbi:MAG: hypothetical protein NXI00_22395, partial [Cytophagales bacterium]|nr:hypothetical protein [Cytophagales bacterium]